MTLILIRVVGNTLAYRLSGQAVKGGLGWILRWIVVTVLVLGFVPIVRVVFDLGARRVLTSGDNSIADTPRINRRLRDRVGRRIGRHL
ncbi:MAG: hypothetical protein ACPHUJ_12370, partial [Pseudomonadales bacterium]